MHENNHNNNYLSYLQIFPDQLLEPTYLDPENHERLLARSEVERRHHYIEQLGNMFPSGDQHAFVQLITRCLQNDNNRRPTSQELLASLETLRTDIEGPYGDVARADAVGQVVMRRALKKRDLELIAERTESAMKDDEIHQLQHELEYEQACRILILVICKILNNVMYSVYCMHARVILTTCAALCVFMCTMTCSIRLSGLELRANFNMQMNNFIDRILT